MGYIGTTVCRVCVVDDKLKSQTASQEGIQTQVVIEPRQVASPQVEGKDAGVVVT